MIYLERNGGASSRAVQGTKALMLSLVLACSTSLNAGPREQARRIHDRLVGTPPSETLLSQMETEIRDNNDPDAAALLALEQPDFYNVTLKNLATPWTNEEQTVFAPLNDYSATVIGMVRDDVPFNQLFSADILYIGSSSLGLPAYAMTNNDHYEALEQQGVDLKQHLVATNQSAQTDLPVTATAGVMTTRQAAKAFFVAGTNRAMFRFTLLNHLCTDLEQVKDTTLPSDRIRQDVSRSPGGDSRIFNNNCIGCHTGMEPLTQAYAYYDYDETLQRIVYTAGSVQPKYLNNGNNFKFGYITPDDRWDNYWRMGQNSLMGWDQALPGSGNGAKSMGQELANSDAFAQCQTKKVFKTVCLRDPVDQNDRDQITTMTASFKANNYNLKQVFAESAVYCMGD